MTTRVRIENLARNKSQVHIQHVTVTRGPNGEMVVRPSDGATDLVVTPSQSGTIYVGETLGRCVLIEELPPA